MTESKHEDYCSCGLVKIDNGSEKVCICGQDKQMQSARMSEMLKYINASRGFHNQMNIPQDTEKESVKVLNECIQLQNLKGADYQSAKSTVKQADYYPSGCKTIYEIMHAKMLRIKSLIEADGEPNFEGIEDSAKDLINYSSFMCSYLRGKMDGQEPDRDYLNRKKV